MLDFTPNPIALQLGPLPVYWYGIGYALGLAAAYQVLVRLARRAGENQDLVGNGMILVAIAALVGGRAYHVIDQWALYQDDLLKIVLPPYTGLGVYGGIAAGLVAVILYARRLRQPIWRWADIIAPALFAMQAVAAGATSSTRSSTDRRPRFRGESRSNAPIGSRPTRAGRPFQRRRDFQPLFLYESLSGVLGAAVLIWLGFRLRDRLRAGDLALVFFIWYGVVRFALERSDKTTGRSSASRRHRSCRSCSSSRRSQSCSGAIAAGIRSTRRRRVPTSRPGAPRAGRSNSAATSSDDAQAAARPARRRQRGPGGRSPRLNDRAAGSPWSARAAPGCTGQPGGARGGSRWRGRGPRLARAHPRVDGLDPLPTGSAARPLRPVRAVPVPHPDRRAGSPPVGRIPLDWLRPIAAGWTRSSRCTRSRPSHGPGSWAARRQRSPRPGASA